MVGSTLVPSRVTTSPSTSTSPASISSSHLRRLATPDWASSFCSRIRPSSSVSGRHASCRAPRRRGVGVRRRARPISGRNGASSGSSSSEVDPDPLQEVAGRAVERRRRLGVVPGLLDQPARHQRAHHAVDVHATDRRDAGAADRLLVGDHRERLQRGLGEPCLLPVEHELLDDAGEVLAGVVAPAAGDVAQVEPAPLLGVLLGQRRPAPARPPRPGSRRRRRASGGPAAGRRPSAPPRVPAAARPAVCPASPSLAGSSVS